MSRFRTSRIAVLAGLALAASVLTAVATFGPAAGAGASPKPSPSPSPSAAPAYSVTALGSLGGGYTVGVAMNASGQVTGYSENGKTITLKTCCAGCYSGGSHTPCVEHLYHAFLWSNGTMTDLGTLGGDDSAGRSINGSGEVVGWAQTKTGTSDSVLWNGTKMTDLTTTELSKLSGAGVGAINDSGQLIGGDSQGPFLDTNGKFTQLPTPSYPTPPNTGCSATALNNNGVVLGGCDPNSDLRGVVWQNGTATDIGTLGGPQTGATAINNLGQVTGWSQTSTDADHAFLWANGTMTDLTPNFYPAAINDNGVIVGGDQIYSGGTLQNLNNLIPAGYSINYAVAINDNGQILATGSGGSGTLLLTPN